MHLENERSVSEVLQDIFSNVQDIVRSEVRLAKVELQTEAGKTARAAKSLLAGAVIALYAGALLLLAAVYGLSMVLAPWLAALVVGGFVLLVALVLINVGKGRLRLVTKPEKTVKTLKEDVQWMRDQTR